MSSINDNSIIESKGLVAVIGRPNVGKSTLFNILTGTRKALVKNQPGVTRDIQVEQAEWEGNYFDIMDTGGLTDASDQISQMIKANMKSHLDRADVLVVVMDGREGVVPQDRELMRLVHSTEKPFVLVVNKVDSREKEETLLAEFSEFGAETTIATSFEQRRNVDDILDWIVKNLPEETRTTEKGLTLAIVGKPNAGKSSLTNKLVGEDRQLVSNVAGTTMDAVEVHFEQRGRHYTLIDTAGLRRQAKRKDLESLGAVKSFEAIRRADIILLMIDGEIGPTEQDAKLVEEAVERHKGLIVVANKSDIAPKSREAYREWFRGRVKEVFHFFPDIKISFVSAKTGLGVEKLFREIDEMWEKLNIRITTSDLNDFFFKAIRGAPSPVSGTKIVNFYYLTQTRQVPPSFIAFANHPDAVNPGYRRFLAKQMKKKWDLSGIPLRIFVMKRGGRKHV